MGHSLNMINVALVGANGFIAGLCFGSRLWTAFAVNLFAVAINAAAVFVLLAGL